MKLDIFMSESTRRILCVGPNGVPPTQGDWTLVDTQYHPGIPPHVDNNGWEGSHRIWHHARNALYRRGYTDPSKWAITFSGDGLPELPEVPETQPDGVFSFTSKEIIQSVESPEITPPAGKTSAIVGLVMTGAVVGGLRYASNQDFVKVKVSFGGTALERIDSRNNAYGHCIQYYKGTNLPASGTIKVEIEGDTCMLGPFMAQASFVDSSFAFTYVNHATSISNRALSAAILGAPSIQFWAAACRPRWNTGPFTPGTLDERMMDYTVEASAIIKGGTLWKPTKAVFMPDNDRLGGKLEYDATTGVFTLTREYDAGHPTVGFCIKIADYPEAVPIGDFAYMEIIEATPADFSTQESGTNNVSFNTAYYRQNSEGNRWGNERDTARIRRIVTPDNVTHLSYIRPSDSIARPNRDAFIIFVRGLQIGRHIKFRFIANGIAMRAAMGKTKVPMSSARRVNVSIADWTVLEEDDKNQALMATGGTNLPDSSVPKNS